MKPITQSVEIRQFRKTDLQPIKQLIQKFHPGWFDKNALKNIPTDIQLGKTYIYTVSDKVTGFISLSSLEGQVWLNWIGVDPSYHGQGIGGQLLEKSISILKELSVPNIKVDTVIEQHPPDGTYDKTIQFYLKHGFKVIEKKPIQTFDHFTYRRGILEKSLNQ